MSEQQMEYRCGADGCTKDTPKPCGPRCHARFVAMSAESITEDAPTPDAVAHARANYDRVMVQVEHEKMRGIHREDGIYAKRAEAAWAEVVAAVRAECAAKVRGLPRVSVDVDGCEYPDPDGAYFDAAEVLAALEAQP